MVITKRLSVKPDPRRIVDTQAKGVSYAAPKINKNRDDITQVQAYESGHKGAAKPKARKWF